MADQTNKAADEQPKPDPTESPNPNPNPDGSPGFNTSEDIPAKPAENA